VEWDMVKTKEIISFLWKLLEYFYFAKNFKIYSNTSPHWWNFLPRPNIMIKTFYMCYLFLCWALSNFVDPCWDSFHTPMIKIHVHPNIIILTLALRVTQKHVLHPPNTPTLVSWDSQNIHLPKESMSYAKK
jgi:hypothetical protein